MVARMFDAGSDARAERRATLSAGDAFAWQSVSAHPRAARIPSAMRPESRFSYARSRNAWCSYDFKGRVYRERRKALADVHTVESSDFVEMDDVLEIPTDNHVGPGDGGQGNMESVVGLGASCDAGGFEFQLFRARVQYARATDWIGHPERPAERG
jgi:hypothetical protein